MTDDDKRIQETFEAALSLPDDSSREELLQHEFAGDEAMLNRVRELLKAHDATAGFSEPSPSVQTTTAIGPGTILAGRYKLIENIGEGGMGSVWVAQQLQPIKRRVAIKLVKAGMDSKQVLARFDAERQALAMMDHPNIAKVFDGGMTDAGRPFFVMEYVKGIPFTEYCDQARLSLKERLQLFIPVCHAVQHAHHKGIVHRDLKPSNILMCLYDGTPVPKVIDFGLAKAMHQPLTEHSINTGHGMMIGTPLYMSPEQAELNNLDVDTRTDIYSLGVVLYELLVGTTPLERHTFQKAAYDEMMRLIKEVEPPKPSVRLSASDRLPSIAAQRNIDPRDLRRSLAGELDWIVMKSLEKERSRRYETANGLSRDIERFLNDEAVEACPPSRLYLMRKFIKKYKSQVVTAGVVCLSLCAGFLCLGIGFWQANLERMRANKKTEEAQAYREQSEQHAAIASQERNQARTDASRALEAEKNATIAASREEEAKRRIEATLARSNFFLANARWKERRGDQARAILHSIPQQHRHIEWDICNCMFEGSYATLFGHREGIRSVAVAPGGKLAASGDYEGKIRIWDLASGQLHRTINAHSDNITSLDFSRDGTCLLSGSDDKTVKQWETTTGRMKLKMTDHKDWINCVRYSPDGSIIASGARDNSVMLRDAATGRILLRIVSPVNTRYGAKSIDFSPDGKLIGILWDHNSIELRDTEIGEVKSSHSFTSNSTHVFRFGRDGKSFVVGNCEGGLFAWSIDKRNPKTTIQQAHDGSIYGIDFNQDGTKMLTSSADGTIKLWNTDGYSFQRAFVGHTDAVMSAVFSPRGDRIVSGSVDKTVKLWESETEFGLPALRGHTWWVTSLAYNPNSRDLASGSLDGSFAVWDVYTRDRRREVRDDGRVNDLKFSPDGSMIATCADSGTISLWNAVDFEKIATLKMLNGPATSLKFMPDGKTILSGGKDSTNLWRLTTRVSDDAFSFRKDYDSKVDASADGRYCAFGRHGVDGICIVDMFSKSVRELTTASDNSGSACIAFGKRNPIVASGDESGEIFIWNLEADRKHPIVELNGHMLGVSSLVFSSDDSRLFSVGGDNALKIWDVANGHELLNVKGHGDGVTSVAVANDCSTVATGSMDSSIKIWGTDATFEFTDQILLEEGILDFGLNDDGSHLGILTQERKLLLYQNIQSKFERMPQSSEPATTMAVTRFGFVPESLMLYFEVENSAGQYAYNLASGEINPVKRWPDGLVKKVELSDGRQLYVHGRSAYLVRATDALRERCEALSK
jgi:eukaryotic-like serine/threonine-protein kinase